MCGYNHTFAQACLVCEMILKLALWPVCLFSAINDIWQNSSTCSVILKVKIWRGLFLQENPDLLSYSKSGPTLTPPIKDYPFPDGEYNDVTKQWWSFVLLIASNTYSYQFIYVQFWYK